MSRTLFLGAAALAASSLIWAQSPGTDGKAPPPPYQSAFEGYRPFEAGDVQDWRESNETVREVGGWRAYAREIQRGSSEAVSPKAAASAAQPGGHESAPQPAKPHQGHHR